MSYAKLDMSTWNCLMRRMTSSHKDYEEINELNNMLCMAINSHMLRAIVDMPVEEYRALIGTLKMELFDRLDGGVFRDYISVMDIKDKGE